MQKMKNNVHLEGWVYESKLELKVTGAQAKTPGVEFISGVLNVATDNEKLNIVPVHFTYVTAVTAQGKPNATFNTLKAIIDGKIGTVMSGNPGFVRIDTALDLNEFYSNRNGAEELVSARRNEGGFVHSITETELIADENKRATFEVDMVITKATHFEANEEKNTPEYLNLFGYIFNFRGAPLPYDFSVYHPGAISYFEGLEISGKNPVFTKLRGIEVNQTVVRTYEEESAFGDPSVREVKSSHRDFVVNWAAAEPYVWDDAETITAAELSEALAKREIALADIKKRQDEYRASKGSAIPAAAATPTTGTKKPVYNF